MFPKQGQVEFGPFRLVFFIYLIFLVFKSKIINNKTIKIKKLSCCFVGDDKEQASTEPLFFLLNLSAAVVFLS